LKTNPLEEKKKEGLEIKNQVQEILQEKEKRKNLDLDSYK
jgi:hypothetical protein